MVGLAVAQPARVTEYKIRIIGGLTVTPLDRSGAFHGDVTNHAYRLAPYRRASTLLGTSGPQRTTDPRDKIWKARVYGVSLPTGVQAAGSGTL